MICDAVSDVSRLVMDLLGGEGVSTARRPVYRVSMKLLSLQQRLLLDVVSLQHITTALCSVDGANLRLDVSLNQQEVTRGLSRMFQRVSQEVEVDVSEEAPEKICRLIFRLYDGTRSGSVCVASLKTLLIVLSADSLLQKYTALVGVAEERAGSEWRSGSISRCGLRSLLHDLSQVPAAVQEEGLFCGVDEAVMSCFNKVLSQTTSREHVLSWLKSEPPLLLWLPTLYRLSVSQGVCHSVRCHICKAHPITGLRYRCVKCVNVHVCQSCFLADRQTRKHKRHHSVLEFCTQPTWRETLSSLVYNTRCALLPRRYTRREADRRRALMWAEPSETYDSAPPPSDPSPSLAASAVSHHASSSTHISHDASFSSKFVQTGDETQPEKAAALIADVRDLQRDKWLLEQQLQAWRLNIQSEQGILEDRCSDMEVTMETLKTHHVCLQGLLTQALSKMEAQPMSQCVAVSTEENVVTSSDVGKDTVEEGEEQQEEEDKKEGEEEEEQEEDKREDKKEEEVIKREPQNQFPVMHLDTPTSRDNHCQEEAEPEGDRFEDDRAGPQEVREDCGWCSPEELLQETVDRLKTEMETDRWRHTGSGQCDQKPFGKGGGGCGERKRVELAEAAGQVGDSIHHLVDAVRTTFDSELVNSLPRYNGDQL